MSTVTPQTLGVVKLSALTREYVRCVVAATEAGVVVNPTADTVEFAFPVSGVAPSSWIAGGWDTDTSNPNKPVYRARITVGVTPASAVLAAGTYDAWVRITDGSTEKVVRQIGYLYLL